MKNQSYSGKYSCSAYSNMVSFLTPEKSAAAKMLCDELNSISSFKETTAYAKKAIATKKEFVSYYCTEYFERRQQPIEGSKWFAAKTKELAQVCYGDIGKLVLANMPSYGCSNDAKIVHSYAAKYSLAEDDPELAKLLTKTAKLCKK